MEYIEQMFQEFQKNPESVPLEWRYFFEGVEFSGKFSSGTGTGSAKEVDVYNLIEKKQFLLKAQR
jgi:2-oxoglutarate dehydrogenase complex dehydrogenase (E1) component-like enzyme